MKRIHSKFIAVSALIYLLCLGPNLEAKEENVVVDALCEYGRSLYNQGDIDNAIHEFSKALLIEPNNPLALSYLEKLGMDRGLYRGGRTSLSRVGHMARQVTYYKGEVGNLQEQKASADEAIRHVTKEKARLKETISRKEEALKETKQKIGNIVLDFREADDENQAKIKSLSDDINGKQQELEEQKKLSSKQLKELSLQQLALYKKQVELEDMKKVARGAQEKTEDLDVHLGNQIEDLTEELARKEKEVQAIREDFQSKLEAMTPPENENQPSQNVDKLVEYIQKYNASEAALCETRAQYEAKIADLEKEINQLKINSESPTTVTDDKVESLEFALSAAKENMAALNEQISLLESALPVSRDELVMSKNSEIKNQEKLLQEKDDMIKSLQNELAEIHADLGLESEIESEEEAYAYTGDIDLAELLKRKDKCIADLKAKLVVARKKLNSLAKSANNEVKVPPAGQTDQIKEEPANNGNQLFEQDVIIKGKNEDIKKLKEQLSDMEERLNLHQRIIKEKEEQIKTLNDDLKKVLERDVENPE